MGNTDNIQLFVDDCRNLGLTVLSPDINSSSYRFEDIDSSTILYGLGAIKGIGESLVDQIINEIRGFYIHDENQDLNNFEFFKLFRLWVEKLSSVKIIDKDTINDIVNASQKDLNISGKNLFIPLSCLLYTSPSPRD